MTKSLLILLCVFLNVPAVFSQDIQVDFEDEKEIKRIVDGVSKRIFKDSKIELMDIDDIVSEVEKENDKNLNSAKQSVKNDSINNVVQGLNEKLKNNNQFEESFKDMGQRLDPNSLESEMLKESGLPSNDNFKMPHKNISSLAPEGFTDLLEAPSLKELPPIPGSRVKTKYLNLVDSIRSINLSDGKMKLSEKVDGKAKEVTIKEKQSIKDKTYFEGIVGVLGDNVKMVRISPALGYQMMKKYSMGLGPEFRVNQGKGHPMSLIGMRTFAKYEVIKKKVYFQFEDVATPLRKIGEAEEQKGNRKTMDHSILLGGGYLLHLNKSSSLNFSFMYRLNKNNLYFNDVSPLSFRLGVSSFGGSRNK